jgi:tyrosine decarboxylase/aspartate 1-decarboxylase
MQRAEPQDFARVLSSMCTVPHPEARAAAERFLASNPGDPGTYETVAALEEKAIAMLGEVAGHSDAAGYIASGGTEANIQAVRIARNRARDDIANPNIVVPESAHFSFTKAADVLGVELRRAPLTEYRANLDAMAELADEDTVLMVGVAGTTEYGRVDPIPAIASIAHEHGALCHVDAAWGGFVLPFTDYEWNFEHTAVDTMTIDPHKMGQAVVPAGGLLTRTSALLDPLAIDTPYLESTSQVTLTGTRSGAGVASAVAAMDALWPDGYREAAKQGQDNAEWFAHALETRGYDAVDPTLPLVTADIPQEIIEELRERDWRISKTGNGELRVVMMPHVTREMLRAFLDDLDRIE